MKKEDSSSYSYQVLIVKVMSLSWDGGLSGISVGGQTDTVRIIRDNLEDNLYEYICIEMYGYV